MKIKTIICSLGVALLSVTPSFAAATTSSTTTGEGGKLKREDMVRLSLNGVVESIDQTTRAVTLRGSQGKRIDLTVSPEVKCLNEVAVGDTVHVEYVASILAELREATAEEKASPLTLTAADGRTPTGTTPAGLAGVQVRAVVTVEVLDRLNQTVTVKGPNGGTKTVDVKDPAKLKQMRIGDTIVVTYTEAVALGLEKLASAPAPAAAAK